MTTARTVSDPTSELNVPGARAELEARGYLVVPDVLDAAFAADLAQAVDRLGGEDRDRYGRDYLYRLGQEGFVINVGDRDPAFARLLMSRPTQPLVDAVLGPDAFLYLYQGVVVPSGGGAGAYPWKWHCDLFHVTQEVGDPSFVPGLNCLYYLDDVDADNGATWVIPATQGLGVDQVPVADPEYLARAPRQVTARAGSVIVFNPLLWHCAGHNRTDRPRRAVKMLYVHSWMLPQLDYARATRQQVLASLDDDGRRILGCSSVVSRSFEEMVAMSR
jgi:ectoine hydroxylase-related dioxygenase (phytanoyl-CoA dioxygenase family)